MHDDVSGGRRVAVIGGGVTGLAAAHRVLELDSSCQVTLFEASDHLGGVLKTENENGFLVEAGADNFITTVPWGLDLCRRIGFEDQLIPTNTGYRHAFVVCRGKLHHLPDGFVVMAPGKMWPIVTTPLLSPVGKLRLACEYFVPRRKKSGDESLAAFIRRRFGREVYDRLVQPLVGGIYTGDPNKLSLRSTMPRFAEMEREHGSLIRAMMHQAKGTNKKRGTTSSGARYSMFVAPREGMSSLVDAIAAKLPEDCIQLGTAVTQIARAGQGWRLWLRNADEQIADFDAVILATPAKPTSRLMEHLDRELELKIGGIHHARCSIVSMGYLRSQISHPLDGFGVVVPAIEKRQILSASFSSVKYPNRAPDDSVLIRVFIGGDCQPELADRSSEQLLQIAHEELRELLGIRGEPTLQVVCRRGVKMPQYFLNHDEKVARIRERLIRHRGLYLAGNAYDGVGIPNCIHSGELAAEKLVKETASPKLQTA